MKLVNHETYHIDHSELILLHVIRNLQFYRGASMLISLKKKEDIFATHLIMLGQAYPRQTKRESREESGGDD